jgi:hypothetical protein
MKSLSNLSELEGKFVKVKYGPNKRGYNEVSDITAFSSTPTATAPLSSKEAEEKGDLPF